MNYCAQRGEQGKHYLRQVFAQPLQASIREGFRLKAFLALQELHKGLLELLRNDDELEKIPPQRPGEKKLLRRR